MSINIFRDGLLNISNERFDRPLFHCSDGATFKKVQSAFKHEMHIRITSFFPESALEESMKRNRHNFYFDRHLSLKCGIYRVVLKNAVDLQVVKYFFRGLDEKLGYPDKPEDFPIEVDIEIFYDKIPGVLIDNAQWRIYEGERS